MDAPVQFYEYWYFHLPNYALAVLMYSLVGRFILSLVFAPDSTNYIYRAFIRLTDPVVRVVRFITPRTVPPLLTVLLSVVWMLMLRFALLVGFAAAGLAPRIAG